MSRLSKVLFGLLFGFLCIFNGVAAEKTTFDDSFFRSKTLSPIDVETIELLSSKGEDTDTLHFFEINHGHPKYVPGTVYGRVFETEPFVTGKRIGVYLKSSRFIHQFRFWLKSVENSANRLDLVVRSSPIVTDWSSLRWELSKEWQNQEVCLVVESVAPLHETSVFAFSEPFVPADAQWEGNWSAGLSAVLKVLIYGVLLLFPAVVILAFIHSRWSLFTQPQSVFPGILIVTTVLALLVFWLYYLSSTLGFVCGVGLYLLAALSLAKASLWGFIRKSILKNVFIRDSVHLCFLAVLFIIFTGYLYGGWDDTAQIAKTRFLSWMLPDDNRLPGIFTERLFLGQPLSPFFTQWLSSDRPPLQSALLLLIRPFFIDPSNDAQLVSMLLQASMVVFVYHFLVGVARLSCRQAVLVSLSLIFTASFMLNGFFVWPKLLPLSYLFLVTIMLFRGASLWGENREWLRSIFIGTVSAFAMMTHGGSVFALVPLFLTAMMFWVFPHPRYWVAMIFPYFLLFAPWMIHQKFVDPPGDLLLRWHLAGFYEPSELSFPQILIQQYSNLDFFEWWQNRLENLRVIWGNWSTARNLLYPYQFSNHFVQLREGMFLSLGILMFFQLQFVVFGLFAIVFQRPRETFIRLVPMLIVFAMGLAMWVILMYHGGSTILHQGTYFLPFAFSLVFVAVVIRLSERIWCLLALVQVLVFGLVWMLPSLPVNLDETWIINRVQPDSFSLIGVVCCLSYAIYLMVRFILKPESAD